MASAPRTFDEDGFRRRAGCLCFAAPELGSDLLGKVLLATSASKIGGFVVPAGGIDPGESPQEAALREAHEEAGVVAAPDSPRLLCWVTDERKRTRTAVFAVSVVRLDDTYEEQPRRSRRWVSVDDAAALLASSPSQALVFRAALAAAGLAHAGAGAPVDGPA